MNELKKIIKTYAYRESIEISKNYLQSYFVSWYEFEANIKSRMNKIFINGFNTFPHKIFKEDLLIIPSVGGVLMTFEDFEFISYCMKYSKDKFLYIIEDFHPKKPPHNFGPSLRFKYPSNISWEQINMNEGISFQLFQLSARNYYVFGDNGCWGRYVANDYFNTIQNIGATPLDITAFKLESSQKYFERLKIVATDLDLAKKWFSFLKWN